MSPNEATSDEPSGEAALSSLSGSLLQPETVERGLNLVAALAQRTLPSSRAVSITLGEGDGPRTSHATDPVARELDEVQYAAGEGPCLTALQGVDTITASVDEASARWPAFAEAAQERGVSAVVCSPLQANDLPVGVLNVYLHTARALEGDEATLAALLAEHGAAVVSCSLGYHEVSTLAGQLQEALESRDLIGQAKGILMKAEGCDASAAFDILVRASQRTNRKLREVAADMVASVGKSR